MEGDLSEQGEKCFRRRRETSLVGIEKLHLSRRGEDHSRGVGYALEGVGALFIGGLELNVVWCCKRT